MITSNISPVGSGLISDRDFAKDKMYSDGLIDEGVANRDTVDMPPPPRLISIAAGSGKSVFARNVNCAGDRPRSRMATKPAKSKTLSSKVIGVDRSDVDQLMCAGRQRSTQTRTPQNELADRAPRFGTADDLDSCRYDDQ